MRIIPQGFRMLVRFNRVGEHQRSSGVWIPDKNEQISRIGVVLAVGDKVGDKWKPGDVFLSDFSGGSVIDSPLLMDFIAIEPDAETLRVITIEDIQCRLDGMDERKLGILHDSDRVIIEQNLRG